MTTEPRLHWLIHEFLNERFRDVGMRNWADSMPNSYEYIINNCNVGLIAEDGHFYSRSQQWVDDGKSAPSYYPTYTKLVHCSNPNFFDILHKDIMTKIWYI